MRCWPRWRGAGIGLLPVIAPYLQIVTASACAGATAAAVLFIDSRGTTFLQKSEDAHWRAAAALSRSVSITYLLAPIYRAGLMAVAQTAAAQEMGGLRD